MSDVLQVDSQVSGECLLEAGARVDADTMDVAERLGRNHISKLLLTYLAKKSDVAKR